MDSLPNNRTPRFTHNDNLNSLLGELKELLEPVQGTLHFTGPHSPAGCIIGNPRSGSTLLLQWLASLDVFSYPSNLLTRFSYAPYIGALVQKMLFDPEFDYQGDFKDIQSDINFCSDLGKSTGALACNEFQHFFRNYMPNIDLQWLDDAMLKKVDCDSIQSGLVSIEKAFGKPFVTKANILQFNLDYFDEHLPSMIWIYIARDPIFVMQSILEAREKYYGNRVAWWSVKPKEYEWLEKMDLNHQIAGQVYYTGKAIKEGLICVPESRKISIEYESFCSDPEEAYHQIIAKYSAQGCHLPPEYKGPSAFKCGNGIRLPREDIDGLQAAYHEFENGLLSSM